MALSQLFSGVSSSEKTRISPSDICDQRNTIKYISVIYICDQKYMWSEISFTVVHDFLHVYSSFECDLRLDACDLTLTLKPYRGLSWILFISTLERLQLTNNCDYFAWLFEQSGLMVLCKLFWAIRLCNVCVESDHVNQQVLDAHTRLLPRYTNTNTNRYKVQTSRLEKSIHKYRPANKTEKIKIQIQIRTWLTNYKS